MIEHQKIRVTAIIQARMGSTRLPGKVLIDVCGKPVLWHMLNRLRLSDNIGDIVLAIPESAHDNKLEDFAKESGFQCFRGSEEDVLSRYYEAAVRFGADIVVRLTADCPLVDPRVTDRIVKEHLNSGADYTSNIIKRTYPQGLDTEVFNYDVLEKVSKEAKQGYEREHVTPYIYRHPEIFKLKSVEASGKLGRPDLRLTVDTEEDLRLMREIFHRLYHQEQVFYIEDVIDLLDEYPELKAINAHIKQKRFSE